MLGAVCTPSSGPKAEGVPNNNQRGLGSGPCRLWGGLDKARHKVPIALLVRLQRLRKDLYKAVKGPSTRPIVLSMILVIPTTSKAFDYFRARRDEIRFTFDPPELCWQDHCRRQGEWFLVIQNPWNDFAPNLDRRSEYDLKNFPNVFPKLVISITLCQKFWSDLKIFRMEIKNASATSSKSN